MKSIYERLNPEILASINKDYQRYPYTTRALKIKLKNSICWDELSIGDVRSIVIHSHHKIIEVDQMDFMFGDKFLIDGINNNR